MKLEGFRIKNYKSIKDTGYCPIDTQTTILLGKNESGKTAILEALRDFTTGIIDYEMSYPIGLEEGESMEISVVVEYMDNEVQHIGGMALRETEGSIEHIYSILQKSSSRLEIILREQSYIFRSPGNGEEVENRVDLNEIYNEAIRHITQQFIDMKIPFDAALFTELDTYESEYEQYQKISAALENISKITFDYDFEDYNNTIAILNKVLSQLGIFIQIGVASEVFQIIPKFYFLDFFEQEFPMEIQLENLELPLDPSQYKDFKWNLERSGVTEYKRLLSQNPIEVEQARGVLKESIVQNINHPFASIWPNGAELSATDSAGRLHFYVEENGKSYRIDQRSYGKRKLLISYITLRAFYEDSMKFDEDGTVFKCSILLIDEPGVGLHPSAQKGLLEYFEEISRSNIQIIYATHSPFLAEYDKLERVRTIRKDAHKGTTIHNKQHDPPDGLDTITHLLDTVGMKVDNCLFPFGFVNNVVVEGISDKYYLEGMHAYYLKELNTEKTKIQIAFIASGGNLGGINNMKYIGNILRGWGASVLLIIDNDDDGNEERDKLIEEGWKSDDLLLVVEDYGAIEKVFSGEDRRKYTAMYGGKKEKKSKDFNQACRSGEVLDLEEQTKENIKYIFDQVYARFG